MSKMLRLTKDENKALESRSIEINKALVKMEKAPLKDSELLHKVLIEAIERIDVDKSGQIYIKDL